MKKNKIFKQSIKKQVITGKVIDKNTKINTEKYAMKEIRKALFFIVIASAILLVSTVFISDWNFAQSIRESLNISKLF